MTDPEEIRISDADREAAAQRLHAALGEGRITLVELEERLGVVYAARTAGELRPPLADLPGASPVAAGPARPVGDGTPLSLRTGAGTLRRAGDWHVPAALRLTTGMGTIHLDLSEVRDLPQRIDVEIATGMGEIVIVLPAGGTADVNGVAGSWGEIRTKVPGTAGPGPHLTVHGKVGMGSLTVRGARTGWWKQMMG